MMAQIVFCTLLCVGLLIHAILSYFAIRYWMRDIDRKMTELERWRNERPAGRMRL